MYIVESEFNETSDYATLEDAYWCISSIKFCSLENVALIYFDTKEIYVNFITQEIKSEIKYHK